MFVRWVERGINGCLGCDACQRITDAPGCVQKDAVGEMLTTIVGSDVVVYASPVYVWDFSAQMKALMDRHYCFVKWKHDAGTRSLLEGKPVLLLTTCGGDAATNADLIREIFTREMDYLHCRIIGIYNVPNCTTSSVPGEEVRKTARCMADDISKLFLP
jgi:multimeric flavodoxin WrbA